MPLPTYSLVIRCSALLITLVAYAILGGCGQDDSGGGGAKDAPVLASATVYPSSCKRDGTCLYVVAANVAGEYSINEYEVVVTAVNGNVEPPLCQGDNIAWLGENLAIGIPGVYEPVNSWRICMWDKTAGTFSEGLVRHTDIKQ